MVGVDGSASSQRALEWALRQAGYQGADVVAVHAWQTPVTYGTGAMLMPTEVFAEDAKKALDDILETVAPDEPGIRIEREVVEGNPAKTLIDRSKGADLLVVGNRGHGGFVGALSVSSYCVHHAHCPVIVIRGED
ncbi:universal stress protein [Glycomyces harbinensis]|uniref:universal stress protein n=1 Tax=Glycomyces harbinensis TaxID=58114 RepID=UPI001C40B78B|nr:universal stress protein [Glycomyces harbinensis]